PWSAHPCLPTLKTLDAARPLRSTGVTRFLATTSLAATVSPSVDFPVSPVIRLSCSIDDSMGRGRFLQLPDMSVSPCCPSPPRRSGRLSRAAHSLAGSLRPTPQGSASGVLFLRGHHWVH